MRELKSDAHARARRKLTATPTGFFGNEFENALHARTLKFRAFRFHVGIRDARKTQEVEAELHRVLPGCVGEFIKKRLENPGKSVAARRAKSVCRDAEGHERRAEGIIGQESAGKFVRGNVGGGSELFAFAETDEVILPPDEFPGRIEPALKKMEAGGTVVIVMEVVLAGPEKLHGNANLLGDGRGFEHVIVCETATEAAAGALHVHDDVARGNVEDLRNDLAA